MVNVTSQLAKAGSGVGFSFGVREVEIWCVKGMYRLKLISSEKYSGFKGLTEVQCGISNAAMHSRNNLLHRTIYLKKSIMS